MMWHPSTPPLTQPTHPNPLPTPLPVPPTVAELSEYVMCQGGCICPNHKIYLSKLWNVFVQIIKCIVPNCKRCLSGLQCIELKFWMCRESRYKEGGGRYQPISKPPHTSHHHTFPGGPIFLLLINNWVGWLTSVAASAVLGKGFEEEEKGDTALFCQTHALTFFSCEKSKISQ